jgi:hypothetical protein
MLTDLAQQDLRAGVPGHQAEMRARRRVSAFLRRTVEGCQRLAQLDHDYNLRASLRHGAVMAGMDEADMASLRSAYEFMEASNFRAMMPLSNRRRPPFFELLSARQLESQYGPRRSCVVAEKGRAFHPNERCPRSAAMLLSGLARRRSARSGRPADFASRPFVWPHGIHIDRDGRRPCSRRALVGARHGGARCR